MYLYPRSHAVCVIAGRGLDPGAVRVYRLGVRWRSAGEDV